MGLRVSNLRVYKLREVDAMTEFYCRDEELRKRNKRYAGNKFECIVIYGRRRVVKTALINECCKDKHQN